MKREARIIGIDDGPFTRGDDQKVLVVGTIFRGGQFLDGLVSCKVEQDGVDATDRIIDMINNCKFKPQLQAIFLDGVAVGGFNIIDVDRLSKITDLPVIVVMRNYPDYEKFFKAMDKAGKEEYKEIIDCLKKPIKVNNLYVQYTNNISLEEIRKLLSITCTHSDIPEPVRVAHIIASGIVDGESRGHA